MSKYAVVRDIPDSFQECVTSFPGTSPIDVRLARLQHIRYCNILEDLGLRLIRLEADNALPDCCFVEDTAIVFEELAIITRPGVSSRVLETLATESALKPLKKLFYIESPGTLEGGDVMVIEKNVYIGLSSRTNQAGIDQVATILTPFDYTVIPVKISGTLHLKSVITYPGNEHVIMAEGHFDEAVFSSYKKIIVPEDEAYSANCLSINDKVLIPEGYPKTKSLIENKGFSTLELNMSEFEKADGALTCKSIIF